MTRPLARTVALLVAGALLATACGAQGPGAQEITAIFANTNNLFVGSEVRVLGLKVGQVAAIVPAGEGVRVEMRVDADRPVPADATAHLTPVSLVGERFVQLAPAYTGGTELADGAVIGRDRTTVPADVDDVLASFEQFLEGLDPDAIAELVDALAETIAGQGDGLNQLIAGGADTVRVLSDATEDLTAVVAALGDLNTTLATRDQQIGPFLTDFRTVLQTLTAEKPEIIEGLGNLQRLTLELRPLLDEHTDPLVRDLEVLTTTLATVDRNLDNVGALALQSGRLFAGIGHAVEFPQARLALQNQTEELTTLIEQRLTERLAGVCVRLGFDQCADPAFFEPHVAAMQCDPAAPACGSDRAAFGAALRSAMDAMPDEALEQLEAEARARQDAQPGEAAAPPAGPGPADDPPAPGSGAPAPEGSRLPAPDPRLEELPDDEGSGLLRRLFGGAS
ncbi:MAG: MCE family protein [Egibacteraceae bacterium]